MGPNVACAGLPRFSITHESPSRTLPVLAKANPPFALRNANRPELRLRSAARAAPSGQLWARS